jgi:exonuclease III
MPDIIRLLNSHDIVCIQEHWLLPNELDLLTSLHTDFYAISTSAVDITANILIGRPYGGTAILYRKSLSIGYSAKRVPIDNKCISGLELNTATGPLILLNVYMPTEYHDDDSFEKYVDVCANIGAVFTDSVAANLMLIGDLNCQIDSSSRFFGILSQLITEYDLVVSDMSLLSDVFTYCSDNGNNLSWIDHIITSRSVHSNISDVKVLYDYLCSDHRPLTALLQCTPASFIDIEESDTDSFTSSFQWSNATSAELYNYLSVLSDKLSSICYPNYLSSCSVNCNDAQHISAIDSYYSDVMNCVKQAVEYAIPKKCVHISNYNVPGWNDIVRDKYDLSREAFLDWVASGKPRTGETFDRMSRLHVLKSL